MGFLRLLFASIVLASHSQNAPLYSGAVVVEGFFIISGFYIQMILTEQYTKHAHWRRNFYISRGLRILVPYWVILACLSVAMFLSGKPVTLFSDGAGKYVFPNIFIFGSEYIKLLRTANGCGADDWRHLAIPQVWSVGIELWFYMVAPVLLTCRTRILAAITFLSLTGKVILLGCFYSQVFMPELCGDGLLNGIIPLELGLFTLGALGYRYYNAYLREKPIHPFMRSYNKVLGVVILGTAGLIAGLHYGDKGRPLMMLVTTYAYIIFVAAIVPFVFNTSRENKADRKVGELSYSFYLIHLYVVQNLFVFSAHKHLRFVMMELFTITCAYMVNRWIEAPLDKLRHTRFR